MDKIKDKLKKSYFVVNKLYLLLIFIFLYIADASLGFLYFIFSVFLYGWKLITSRLPMHITGDFPMETYIYKETDKKDLKMDIYYPLSNSNKAFPLVYFAHGGGWISGFRNQPNNVSWCRYLASKGFAVASIDYRYGFKNSMYDILSDYSDGLKYIKERANRLNIDKNNIILMGLSAGGHLSLLYSAYNSFKDYRKNMEGIRSIVAYYPPSNLKDLLDEDNKSIFAKFSTTRTLKAGPNEKEDIYNYYSPINWISDRMIPTLVVHGKMDNVVPFQSSVNLVNRLNEYGVHCRFLISKKGAHSFDTQMKDYATVNIIEKTVRFIRKSVRSD